MFLLPLCRDRIFFNGVVENDRQDLWTNVLLFMRKQENNVRFPDNPLCANENTKSTKDTPRRTKGISFPCSNGHGVTINESSVTALAPKKPQAPLLRLVMTLAGAVGNRLPVQLVSNNNSRT